MLTWKTVDYKSLNLDELYSLLKLRAEVFVVEQDCVYNDLDGLDSEAVHLLCFEKENIIGYLRILPAGTRFTSCSIGRVVVDAMHRKQGIGKELMQRAIQYILGEWKEEKILISAQKYLEEFYSDLGFVVISETYLEDGIPYIKMEYTME